MFTPTKRGASSAEERVGRSAIADLLSLSENDKQDFALSLIDELNARNVTVREPEIMFSCLLPENHANGDENPSASFNWSKMTYHCHACGAGGGIAWMLNEFKQGSFSVNQFLSKQTGLDDDDMLRATQEASNRLLDKPTGFKRMALPRFDPSILDQWDRIPGYLINERHIPIESIIELKIRWDPKTNRAIFPHFWKGELVGWQSRRIVDDGTPKYRNTPDFPKSETLYHLTGPDDGIPLVVESPMSVASKMGVLPGITATFGAAVTEPQARILRAWDAVTLWFDNDKAGWKATRALGEALSPYIDVWVVNSPWNADPADLSDREAVSLVNKASIPYAIWAPPTELKEWNGT